MTTPQKYMVNDLIVSALTWIFALIGLIGIQAAPTARGASFATFGTN